MKWELVISTGLLILSFTVYKRCIIDFFKINNTTANFSP